MKWRFADLPLNQKQLWFEVILDLLLLSAFTLDRCFWPSSPSPAIAVLTVSYVLPLFYSMLKLHTTDATRTDERDKAIEGRGRHAGYLLMTAGIWYILLSSSVPGFRWVTALLVLWLCSRLVTASVQLRIYAGHEAWWPDALITRLNRRRDERLKTLRERMRQ